MRACKMIPISYNDNKLQFYNSYIFDFKNKIKKYEQKGYIGNRKKKSVNEAIRVYGTLDASQRSVFDRDVPDDWQNSQEDILIPSDIFDDETSLFFDWLISDDHLFSLLNAFPEELVDYIKYVQRTFPNINQKSSILYKNIYHVFVNIGYGNISKKELIDATGQICCPYCNRAYIGRVDDKGKTIKGELDHFYTKEIFPFLAISKYNLVPSCSFCNGESGKHTINCFSEKMINPYSLNSCHNDIKFYFEIKDIKAYKRHEIEKAIEIKVHKSTRIQKNLKTFHIEALYKTHIDHIAELILKSEIKYPKPYREMLYDKLKPLNLTDEEIDRVIVGNYVEEKDFHKRPLAKLYYDIAKDLHLIEGEQASNS